jgi:aminopeptidase N
MSEKPKTVHRSDYRPPDYWIDTVELWFDLHEDRTAVKARLEVRREPALSGDVPPLVLDGEALTLRSVAIDGKPLPASRYHVTDESLTIDAPPARFVLETEVEIHPEKNTALSGLYRSGGLFCTQCEAHGFRRITYFLDRPDVMSSYTTHIEADRTRYPVLLSNGNRVDSALVAGRQRVTWRDPFKKPCYLFALVAGDLRCDAGAFTTMSGRKVRLEIWVEPQNVGRTSHALRSLERAMRWDEERFGREYDLDVYMIVAVHDFNMGAMENKGLNVFNAKYVLADPSTATDDEYEAIEAVIAHEYFHNWTGNRVTCRDWFQLTLKEGLTVFRDQIFSADMTSAPVKRIQDVRRLRGGQFPEDAGPMAHPIRPESYVSMDNFYTATVYEKGAEVVRLYQTLLGVDGFRRGMDLYFERHDGQAVTCDDFRAAMADGSGVDLSRLERWYSQAGTPFLRAEGRYDADARRYALTLTQSYPNAAPGDPRLPVPIPVRASLLARDGRELPLALAGEPGAPGDAPRERVLLLEDASARFVFEDVPSAPVPSLLRGFSAPVRLTLKRDREDLAFLLARDTDPVTRWDAGQELAMQILIGLAADVAAGRALALDPLFASAFGGVLKDASLDGSMKALALALPGETLIAQELAEVDPAAIHKARRFAVRSLAEAHRADFAKVFHDCSTGAPYSIERAEIDRRRLGNTALRYLATLEDAGWTARIEKLFQKADNMSDREVAFGLLVDTAGPERERALAAFYEAWRHDPLVLDKWFTAQALSLLPDTPERVRALYRHPDFSISNPNRVRALVGAFASANPQHFHAPDGAGYRFLTDVTLELDPRNPQLAARMASQLAQWRRYEPGRRGLMQQELERIAAQATLSKDVRENVERMLVPAAA